MNSCDLNYHKPLSDKKIDKNYRKNIERKNSGKQTKRPAPHYCRNINHNQRRFFKNSDNVQGKLKLRSIE